MTSGSGVKFEKKIERILFKTGKFSNDIIANNFINTYRHNDILKWYHDVNKFLLENNENLFLIKVYPLYNKNNNHIEFCLILKKDNKLIKCYIECKFGEVDGTTYQKLEYYFNEHKSVNFNANNKSYLIMIYDGTYYLNKRIECINDIKESIKYDATQLILNLNEFKSLLNDFLITNDLEKCIANKK